MSLFHVSARRRGCILPPLWGSANLCLLGSGVPCIAQSMLKCLELNNWRVCKSSIAMLGNPFHSRKHGKIQRIEQLTVGFARPLALAMLWNALHRRKSRKIHKLEQLALGFARCHLCERPKGIRMAGRYFLVRDYSMACEMCYGSMEMRSCF